MDARGATLVEAAIAIPVFLMFFFGIIDVAQVLRQHMIFAEAVRIAGRKAVMEREYCDCDRAFRQEFSSYLEKFSMGGQIRETQIKSATIADTGVPALEVSTRAQIDCLFCFLLPRQGSGNFDFTFSAVIPFETGGRCQNERDCE